MELEVLECLTAQCNEIQVLQAIYTEEPSLFVDPLIIESIETFEFTQCESMWRDVRFELNFHVPNSREEIIIKVLCSLPKNYPNENCNARVSCSHLPSEFLSEILDAYGSFLDETPPGEGQVTEILQWFCDTLPSYYEKLIAHAFEDKREKKKDIKNNGKDDNVVLVRQWIYFHHVYSKSKRKHINFEAKDNNLKGFLKLGKPGVLCVEGEKETVKKYVLSISALIWQKMVQKECNIISPDELHFKDFQEWEGNIGDISALLNNDVLIKGLHTTIGL